MFANVLLMGLLGLMYLMSALSTDRHAYNQKVADHKLLVARQLSELKYAMAASLRPLSHHALLTAPLDQGRLGAAAELLAAEQSKSAADSFAVIKGSCVAWQGIPASWPKGLSCKKLGLSFAKDRFHTRVIGDELVLVTTAPVAGTIDTYHILAIKTLPLAYFHQLREQGSSDFNLQLGKSAEGPGSLAVFRGDDGKALAELTLADGYFGIYPEFLLKNDIFKPKMLPYFFLAAILLALIQLIWHKLQIGRIDQDLAVIYRNRLHLGSGDLAGVFTFRSVLSPSMGRLLAEMENLFSDKESKLVAKELELERQSERALKLEQSLTNYKHQFHLALISNSANLKTEITFTQLKNLIGNLDNKNSTIFKQQLATMIESAEIMSHMCKEWWHGLQRMSARKFFRNLSETPSRFHGSKLEENLAIIKKVSDQLAISSIQSSLALKKNLARIHDIVQLIYDTSQSKLKMAAEQLTIDAIITNNQNLLNRLSPAKLKFHNRSDEKLSAKAVLQVFAPTLADVYFHVYFGLLQHSSAESGGEVYTENRWRQGAFHSQISVATDSSDGGVLRNRASDCFSIAKELCAANEMGIRVEVVPGTRVAVHLSLAESFFTAAEAKAGAQTATAPQTALVSARKAGVAGATRGDAEGQTADQPPGPSAQQGLKENPAGEAS